jgi:uncharacterized protein YgiM (DUF1202 family)
MRVSVNGVIYPLYKGVEDPDSSKIAVQLFYIIEEKTPTRGDLPMSLRFKYIALVLSICAIILCFVIGQGTLVYRSDASIAEAESMQTESPEDKTVENADEATADPEPEQITTPTGAHDEGDIATSEKNSKLEQQDTESTTITTPASTKEVTFEDTDEYLYVKSSGLNVRVGPGTEYDKITTISLNTKIHRTGKGDNGWSRIDYNGEVAYVHSDYLSYEKVEVKKQEQPAKTKPKETIAEEMARRGNIGRLIISSVGVNVALFNTSIYDPDDSQPIVDRSDSAAYMEDAMGYYGFVLIGDHRYQGFSAIKSSIPNRTIAKIDRGSRVDQYICVNKIIGYNGYGDRGGLFDLNGNSLADFYYGKLCLYTCNTDGTITMTFWNPI